MNFQENGIYPQALLPTDHRLGIYFATRRSVRKGDSPHEQGTGSPANRCGAGWVVQRNPDERLAVC
jgi:hypothetical protein